MDKIRQPLISIITIVYNDVQHIEETILSVINQTYSNIEYIIIDGKSTDGTLEVIKRYEHKLNYWISETDNGVFDAMNKGLKHATGDWVNFMNSGDIFENPNVINNIFNEMNYEGKYAIYGDAVYIRPNRKELCKAKDINSIRFNMPTTHQAFFVRLDITNEIKFDTKYRYAADYNMIYFIFKKYGVHKFQHISETVTEYEACNGLTMRNQNKVFREVLNIRQLDIKWLWDYFKYCIKKILLLKS